MDTETHLNKQGYIKSYNITSAENGSIWVNCVTIAIS